MAAKVRHIDNAVDAFGEGSRSIAHTGWGYQTESFATSAIYDAKGFVRSKLQKAHDWTEQFTGGQPYAENMVGFNPRYYKANGQRLKDGYRWHVGDSGRTYGTGVETATAAQRRVQTVVHEFGHQVGYTAWSRWAAEELISHHRRSSRYWDEMRKYDVGLRKTKPRVPKPPRKADSVGTDQVWTNKPNPSHDGAGPRTGGDP